MSRSRNSSSSSVSASASGSASSWASNPAEAPLTWNWSSSLRPAVNGPLVPPLSPAAIQRLFSRYLANPVSVHPPEETQRVIRTLEKIPDMLDAHTLTSDQILSHCVKLMAANHETVKRLACQLLIRIAQEQSDVALLAANVLHLDRQDPNPNVRAVAVATLCSIPGLAEAHAVPAIQAAWQDSNPRVRQAGITGCGKVWLHSPDVVEDHGLVDVLYQRIKDPDPTVLTFTMQTLNYILAQEGGIVINGHMTQYLLQRLPDFPDVELLFVLEYLSDFVSANPAVSSSIKLQMVNQLDPYFESSNGPVFLAAGVLFYRTALDLLARDRAMVGESRLLSDFLIRIRPLMSKFLKPSSQPAIQDFQVQILDFVLSWDRKLSAQASSLWLEFRIKDTKDLAALKGQKIRAMAHVVSAESEVEMVQYLLSLIKSQKLLTEVLTSALLDICERSSDPEVVSAIVTREFQSLAQTDEGTGLVLLRQLRAMDRVLHVGANPDFLRLLFADLHTRRIELNDFQVLANILWALGTYGQQISEAPYILEYLTDEKFDLIEKWELKQSLLYNGFRCFLFNPAVIQPVLGRIGELCSVSKKVNHRINLYFKLLSRPDVLERQRRFLTS